MRRVHVVAEICDGYGVGPGPIHGLERLRWYLAGYRHPVGGTSVKCEVALQDRRAVLGIGYRNGRRLTDCAHSTAMAPRGGAAGFHRGKIGSARLVAPGGGVREGHATVATMLRIGPLPLSMAAAASVGMLPDPMIASG